MTNKTLILTKEEALQVKLAMQQLNVVDAHAYIKFYDEEDKGSYRGVVEHKDQRIVVSSLVNYALEETEHYPTQKDFFEEYGV